MQVGASRSASATSTATVSTAHHGLQLPVESAVLDVDQ
jgi:hypothetical protein